MHWPLHTDSSRQNQPVNDYYLAVSCFNAITLQSWADSFAWIRMMPSCILLDHRLLSLYLIEHKYQEALRWGNGSCTERLLKMVWTLVSSVIIGLVALEGFCGVGCSCSRYIGRVCCLAIDVERCVVSLDWLIFVALMQAGRFSFSEYMAVAGGVNSHK